MRQHTKELLSSRSRIEGGGRGGTTKVWGSQVDICTKNPTTGGFTMCFPRPYEGRKSCLGIAAGWD